MKCSVLGCSKKVTNSVGKNDEFHFCKDHREAWGYFHRGFYAGRGFGVDGLLRRKVWDEAMQEFLKWCRTEIATCTKIAESLMRASKL